MFVHLTEQIYKESVMNIKTIIHSSEYCIISLLKLKTLQYFFLSFLFSLKLNDHHPRATDNDVSYLIITLVKIFWLNSQRTRRCDLFLQRSFITLQLDSKSFNITKYLSNEYLYISAMVLIYFAQMLPKVI